MPFINYQTGNPYVEHVGLTSATTTLTSFTCSANNVKDGWTEINSSLYRASCGFILNIRSNTNQLGPYLIDLGIGSAGNEKVIINNIFITTRATTGVDRLCTVFIPLHISANQRLAIRGQTGYTSNQTAIASVIYVYSDEVVQSFGRCETYGAITSASLGTSVPLDNNAKGSWIELASSISFNAKAMMLAFGNSIDVNQGSIFVDVGVGAAGSEQVIIPNIYNSVQHEQHDVYSYGLLCYPCNIPLGSRIAVRGQYQGNSSHSTGLSMVLYIFG